MFEKSQIVSTHLKRFVSPTQVVKKKKWDHKGLRSKNKWFYF
jgi:hypothetical protein